MLNVAGKIRVINAFMITTNLPEANNGSEIGGKDRQACSNNAEKYGS